MTSEARYFEDVDEGLMLPPLRKEATQMDNLRYHVAARAIGLIHFDGDFARNYGLPGVVLSGQMRIAYLAQLVTDWIGEAGTLRRIAARQKAFDMPDHPLTAKGVVTRKYVEGSDYMLDLDVWIENEHGERTCTGSATVLLPSQTK